LTTVTLEMAAQEATAVKAAQSLLVLQYLKPVR